MDDGTRLHTAAWTRDISRNCLYPGGKIYAFTSRLTLHALIRIHKTTVRSRFSFSKIVIQQFNTTFL